ncbi:hypothetical protein [Phycicoccus sp. Root101]|uniref:hypothetical protein n=1 Tax=Phycicoccus sp. Root101 TaxID=1736421 RepID=UPI0012FB33F1|nr:hypothetical protein [Phycicoccus sp. Root101]
MASGILPNIDNHRVQGWVSSPGLAAKILTSGEHQQGSTGSLVDEVASLPRELRRLGALWLAQQSRVSDELPLVVYQGLALDGPAVLGNERTALLLVQVPRVATGLAEPQALALLKPLWSLASAAPDPYDPVSHRSSAATALIHLISSRPEAEAKFVRDYVDTSLPRRDLALDLLARSIRTRGSKSSESIVRLLSQLTLSAEEQTRFASSADVAQRTDPARQHRTSRVSGTLLGALIGRAWLALVIGLAPMTLIGVLLARHLDMRSPFPSAWTELLQSLPLSGIAPEAALAVIALIATINVFTVQLSTTRLPATVARVSGQPWQLAAAYSAAITLLGTTVVSFVPVPRYWHLLEIGYTTGALVWLATALVRIFRRTDAQEACRVYVGRNIRRWNRAGREFGRTQWHAVQLSRAIEALPFAGASSQREMIGHDLRTVDADTRGIFLPSRKRLRKVLARPEFEEGAYLQFPVGFGQVVSLGRALAVLRLPSPIPRSGHALTRELINCLQPIEAGNVEDVSTQAITLAAFALRAAEDGDSRLAENIAGHASTIVTSHLACIQRSRETCRGRYGGPSPESGSQSPPMFPVTPVLIDMIGMLINSAAKSERVCDTAESLLVRCLNAAGPSEHAAVILVSLISDTTPDIEPSRLCNWLRFAGLSALRHDSPHELQSVAGQLATLAAQATFTPDALRGVAALSAATSRLRPKQFSTVWDEFVKASLSSQDAKVLVQYPMYVGAAALLAGNSSAALTCARTLDAPAKRSMVMKLTDYDHVAVEATVAELSGIDLGEVATTTLERFRDFLAVVKS